jgi:L-lactate dehydrogenase complex protein LldG
VSARERILERLRAARALPLPTPAIVERTDDDVPADERVARLSGQLLAAHAEVIDARSDDWRLTVADACKRLDILRLVSAPNVPTLELEKSAVAVRHFGGMREHKPELFQHTDAGLTVADCALAATGMLVLASSPQQPRSLSLVPPIHICLIEANRIHASLNDALAAEGWTKTLPTNLIFISGPSKTADIQQTLAYGAHGPKRLVVIIVAAGSLV